MDDNAYRDDDVDPVAYWRRRVFILIAGLGVIGLLAWLASGGGGGTGRTAAEASRAAAAAEQAANGLPAAAYGSVSPAATAAVASISPTAGASTTRSKAGRRVAARTSRQPGRPGHCLPDDIVLSLFSAKPAYAPPERPHFDVYAVSTAPAPCAVSFGPAVVHVIVAAKGGRVVWNSARCVQPVRRTVRLARGVPAQLSVSWNPAATRPHGCLARGRTSGWLTARAAMGAQVSPAYYFEFAPRRTPRH